MRGATASASELRGKLHCFSPGTARLTRLLFNTRSHSLVDSLGMRLEPSTGTGNFPSHVLELRAGNKKIHVALEAQSIPALAIAATTRDPSVRNALIRLILDAPLGTLSRILGQAVEPTSFSEIETNRDSVSGMLKSGIAVLIGNARERTCHNVVIDASGDWNSLEHNLNKAPSGNANPILPLAIPARVVAGTRCYRPRFLQTVRPGDVLLNCFQDKATCDELPNVNIFWGAPQGRQLVARGHLQNRSITIEDVPTMTVDTARNPPGHAETRQSLSSAIQDLELPIQLELDSLALPLERLCNLQPGHVLELPVSVADTQIRLVSYGQTLGFGKLVAVGENLGLQIVQMTASNLSATQQLDGETKADAHTVGFGDHEFDA